MPTTVFDQFTRRTADVTAQLTALGIPLTAPPLPPAADPTDLWASNYPLPVDRSTLAWCTAAQMLADHHHTGIDRQVLAADALLRELGVRGLAQLHSDLHHGAPVDYRFTRCPYCSGIGEDPTQPTCGEFGCAPWLEFAGHDHPCPVCPDDYQPEWFAEERMADLEELLADAIEEREEHASLRYRLGTLLRRRGMRS
ncbi:hypothetical protein OIU91_43040 (plasmid) [Streptomyces sp. NBC_01456]|uniref:hypothetical protein n=1 Tax=unclassified Streptomyces TaxID=2593676 RepID=UPI002E33BCCB|nr:MULTISPECIES: hypothetical protein [unclassified Streptomyces]